MTRISGRLHNPEAGIYDCRMTNCRIIGSLAFAHWIGIEIRCPTCGHLCELVQEGSEVASVCRQCQRETPS